MNIAYNEDCLAAMRKMKNNEFDLAVVDPPYGIGINHNMGRRHGDKPSEYKKVNWDDAPPPLEYFNELCRVSKNQIIWGANYFIEAIPLANSKCWLCWDKGFSEDVSFASFELAWTSFDQPCKRLALSSAQNGRIHPTQKPVALYAWIFSRYAKPGDRILDTHLGSGSSRIAAHDAGLRFVGYEIDPEYFEAQEERYQAHAAQISIFAGGGVLVFHILLHKATRPPRISLYIIYKEAEQMEISVKMTSDEFLEFMAWKSDKARYTEMEKNLRRAPAMIAASLRHGVQQQDGPRAKFKIIDHEHLGDAWDMAAEFMPK